MPAFLPTSTRHLLRLVDRIRRDRRGVAAVEFAFILPIMVTLYFGMAELTNAISLDRKVTLVSRTLADLVGRTQTMTTADMRNVFDAAGAVMSPFPMTEAKMAVSNISVSKQNGSLRGKVDWSCGRGTGAPTLTVGADYPVPEGFQNEGTAFIVAQVGTTYRPMVGEALFKHVTGNSSGYITLNETTPWPVRNVQTVAWQAGQSCPTS